MRLSSRRHAATARVARCVHGVVTVVALVGLSARAVHGQITPLDTLGINYPGWHSADQVKPSISVATSFDSARGLWTYDYAVSNGSDAQQAISSIGFGLDPLTAPSAPLTASAPAGWKALVFPYSANTTLPGVEFFALFADDSLGPASGPPPSRIQAGQTLGGFTITSPYPPGYARTYVQGYVELPPLDDVGDVRPPHDTTNSQRGLTIFPNQYILAPSAAAREAPSGDQWVGLIRFGQPAGAGLADAVPIALKFGAAAEQPERLKFRVLLNQKDVTRAFRPARAGGADLAAVFHLGASPLVRGENRLTVVVEGSASGNRRSERRDFRVIVPLDKGSRADRR